MPSYTSLPHSSIPHTHNTPFQWSIPLHIHAYNLFTPYYQHSTPLLTSIYTCIPHTSKIPHIYPLAFAILHFAINTLLLLPYSDIIAVLCTYMPTIIIHPIIINATACWWLTWAVMMGWIQCSPYFHAILLVGTVYLWVKFWPVLWKL